LGVSPSIDPVGATCRADTPHMVAKAYCQGTPLRGEIEARDGSRLDEATAAATVALAARFGAGPVVGGIQALVVQVVR
jgi:hypothetical protein